MQLTFLKAMSQLSSRACTNANVSTRVRIGKTREAYAQTRETCKEAHLEAAWPTGLTFRVGDRLDLYVPEGQGLTVMTDPDGHDYDVKHYQAALVQNYATRLRKALDPADWDQLLGGHGPGLFDQPVQDMQVGWRPVTDQERSGAP